ncbi:MAG: peptidase S41, partial [Synechococcaceae cyanobacterium RM1_1_27]|nr:peptidase S41 [Synechococcaceae cyanobacterium RM1_1_27]
MAPDLPLPLEASPANPVMMDFTAGEVAPANGIPIEPGSPFLPPEYQAGADLRQLVGLFINDSLDAGSQAGAVNYNELYQQVLARGYSNPQPTQEIEYEVIIETLERFGDPVDQFLPPEAFRALLSQARTPLESRILGTGVMYFRIPELTPATPQQIRRALYLEDYSQGILLDLRGSTGYDPQVIADVARLFLPRSITNLVVTEDRFGQLTTWNSPELPIGAGVPLVVLVDGQTRQGAVLLASQLAASGQVAILGQPTQGTDRQTRFFLLPSGAAVEMAVGRWRTGENRPIVDGLTPMQAISGSDGDWLNAGL